MPVASGASGPSRSRSRGEVGARGALGGIEQRQRALDGVGSAWEERVGTAAGLGVGFVGEARQRPLALLARLAALLAVHRQALEARDLPLALDARGVVGRQAARSGADAVAQLQREVRGGGAHELADVVDGDLVVGLRRLGCSASASRSVRSLGWASRRG